ncbi:MAG: hypothetical protein MUF71_07960 [Candidatus Kapabacteria bacterium]|jgi:hypothetical protein|nr:hypothetical protein [Candidatus Kapabacteria bacterium]
MNEEQLQRMLAILEEILLGQEHANNMLTEISKRLCAVERRFTDMERQMGITYPRPPRRFVKGITDTWQSLN